MTSTHPLVSFVVPVKNDAENLRRCLKSISEASLGIASEMIVADNGSTDSSREVAAEANARVLNLPGLRVAALRNAGARQAAAELVAFVDADHELDPGWLRAGLELLGESDIVAAGAQCHAPNDATWVQRMYDVLRNHERGRRSVGWLPSGNLIVRKRVFEQLSGFDEALETCEDVDLSQRAIANGGQLVADDRLRSIHFGDPRTLKALFLGEVWRGRDNLRVSLRGPITWRTLPSIAIPLLNLMGLGSILIGLVTWGGNRFWFLAAGGIIFGGLASTRAVTMVMRTATRGNIGVFASQALLVAATYDLARALAIVVRGSHAVRRKQ